MIQSVNHHLGTILKIIWADLINILKPRVARYFMKSQCIFPDIVKLQRELNATELYV